MKKPKIKTSVKKSDTELVFGNIIHRFIDDSGNIHAHTVCERIFVNRNNERYDVSIESMIETKYPTKNEDVTSSIDDNMVLAWKEKANGYISIIADRYDESIYSIYIKCNEAILWYKYDRKSNKYESMQKLKQQTHTIMPTSRYIDIFLEIMRFITNRMI